MTGSSNKLIVQQRSDSDTKRKLNSSEHSSNPRTPVRIKMSLGHHRSLSLSPELRTLRDKIFKALPQEPHYRPFSNYCSNVREGLKLGLDVVFLNLTQRFNNSVDPLEFLSDIDDYMAQISELESMGYNVIKLWERFDALRLIAEQDKEVQDQLVEAETKKNDKLVKVEMTEFRVSELEAEIKTLRAALKAQNSEIDNTKLKMMKLKENSKKFVDGFTSAAQAAWK